MESDSVSHPYSEGRDEDEACAGPGFHQGPVEVQGPAFGLNLGWRELVSRPLSHKVSQNLRFYGLPRLVGDSVTREFYGPLSDSTISLSVLDHLSQRER